MRFIHIHTSIAIAICQGLFLAVPVPAQEASQAGQIFSFGAGARALGLGSAYTAVARDASSLYYNPSGLGLLPNRQMTFMHANLFEGASYDYLGYAHHLPAFIPQTGAWGAELIRLGIGEAESRNASNTATGSFGYSEFAFGLGGGVRGLGLPALSLGAKLKGLRRTLAGSSDSLYGLDAGAQYDGLLSQRLLLGAVVQNLVSLKTGDTSDRLPLGLRLGAAYRVVGGLILATDLSHSGEFRIGSEYVFGIAALRAGYEGKGLSFGGGLDFRQGYQLDIALAQHPTLGMSQRISLGYRFGARLPPRTEAAAQEYLGNGKLELKDRDYIEALKSMETAVGLAPKLESGVWIAKSRSLRALVDAMGLPGRPEDQRILKEESEASELAYLAVAAYMEKEEARAMLLAHAASGTSPEEAYKRLLQATSRLTRMPVQRDDILPVGSLVQQKLSRVVEAVYTRNYKAAVREGREATWLAPENPVAWTRLGSAYFALEDREMARKAYQRALELDPGNASVRKFMQLQGWER